MSKSEILSEPLLTAIGDRIAKLRTARGLSVAEFAEASNFARGYIWRAENGKLNLNATTLARFAGTLGVSLKDFFEGIEVNADEIPKRSFKWRNREGSDMRPKRGSESQDD